MKRINVIIFSILVCNFVFGNSNAVITGKIGHRSMPCPGYPEMACPAIDVVKITNDTATFVLVQGGQMLFDPQQLGNYSVGDMISIYGNFYKGEDDYNNEEFYILKITAILKDVSSDNFSAKCKNNAGEYGDQSTTPVITIENDSVIIKHINIWQCCPIFALKFSEVINDTLYVTFSDTATAQCDCMCNFEVRISTIKSVSQTLKVHYNGVVYDLNASDIKQINNQYIQILPNPTEGIIEIRGVENYDNMNYEVYNSVGQMTQSGKLKQMIDLSSRKGIYILTIMQNQKIITQEKIIVK